MEPGLSPEELERKRQMTIESFDRLLGAVRASMPRSQFRGKLLVTLTSFRDLFAAASIEELALLDRAHVDSGVRDD